MSESPCRTNLWMHPLLSRYSMPAATFTVILTNILAVRLWPSWRKKERKSPPCGEERQTHTHESVKSCPEGPSGRRLWTLTPDELHDDVDGLPLGANTNQLHDVGMVVALQDPARQTAAAVSHACMHAKRCRVCVRVCATWLPSGTCSSARVPGSPCRSSQLQQCYCVVKGRCTLLQSSPVYVCVCVMGTTTQSVVVTATTIFHCTDCAAELRATSD